MDRLLAAERGMKAAPIEMPEVREEQIVEPVVVQQDVQEVDQGGDYGEFEESKPAGMEKEAEQESPKEANLRILRLKAARAEQAERERDEALRYIESLKKQGNSPKIVDPEPEDDDIFSEDDYDDAKFSKVSSTVKKLRQEIKQLKREQSQASVTSVEAKLRAMYPDIDSVLSEDNLNRLSEEYPELAESLGANPNFFNKASGSYKMIKKLGIYEDPVIKADVARVQKNAAKPRPLTSISPQHGESPLTRANAFENGLTDELQKQLHREMVMAIRSR